VRARRIRPRLTPRDDAQEVLNETLLVENALRSARTAMDQLGTEDPEAELRRVVEDRGKLDLAPADARSGPAAGTGQPAELDKGAGR
jgi:hypothetical protein